MKTSAVVLKMLSLHVYVCFCRCFEQQIRVIQNSESFSDAVDSEFKKSSVSPSLLTSD